MELIIGLVVASLLFLPVVILLIVRSQMSKKINVLNKTIIELSAGKDIHSVQQAKKDFKKSKKKERRLQRQIKIKARSIRNAKVPNLHRVEGFIGTNIINIIGIASILAAVALFVKFSFTNELRSYTSRIVISSLFGLSLIVTGFFVKKKTPVFSSILTGGGLATFYFVIGISYLIFNLMDWQTALLLTGACTLFSILLSVGYNQGYVAFIAVCGAYVTYFIIKPSPQFYYIPQLYLLLITVAVLILSVIKRWQLLYLSAYIFNILTYGFWIYQNIDQPYFDKSFSLIIGSFLYAFLYASAMVYNVRRKDDFNALDFLYILSLNAGYFGIGLLIFDLVEDGLYKGLFTSSLALFNLIILLVLNKIKGIDKNILYLVVGLVMTYITLIAPIQLDGNSVTLFWGCEAVILVFLQTKVEFRLIKNASLGVAGLMLVSLFLDWQSVYFAEQTNFSMLLNKGFLATIFVVSSLSIYSYLFGKLNPKEKIVLVPIAFWHMAAIVVTFGIAYTGGVLELHKYVSLEHDNSALNQVIIASYTAFFIYAFQLFTDLTSNKKLGNIAIILATITLLTQLIQVEYASIQLRNDYLMEKVNFYFFLIHYGGAIISMLMIGRYYKFIHHTYKMWSGIHHLTFWFLGAAVVALASLEAEHIYVILHFDRLENLETLTTKSIHFIYPIVWMASGAIMIISGIVKGIKDVRTVGLIILLVTSFKFGIYDFKELVNDELIFVFLAFGLTLLPVSFIYQKNKNKLEALKLDKGNEEAN